MGDHGLIDDIYEAALVPELWTRVLDRMAEIADGEGTLLFANSGEHPLDLLRRDPGHDHKVGQ